MSVNSSIREALKPFGYPCVPDVYKGKEKRYFVFNPSDDRGADWGDNEPGTIKMTMQVHVFMPDEENYLSLKNKVREALFAAGTTYPAITMLRETENNVRHLVFEFEMLEEREE